MSGCQARGNWYQKRLGRQAVMLILDLWSIPSLLLSFSFLSRSILDTANGGLGSTFIWAESN